MVTKKKQTKKQTKKVPKKVVAKKPVKKVVKKAGKTSSEKKAEVTNFYEQINKAFDEELKKQTAVELASESESSCCSYGCDQPAALAPVEPDFIKVSFFSKLVNFFKRLFS